jgi:phosphopantothenoylcysteine synthetase/decarboxylase
VNKKKILLGITAGIAAYKSCDLIRELKKKGHEVKCVLTQDALNFVTPLTIETLSQNKVYSTLFSQQQERDPVHIALSDWPDIIAVVPATADIVSKVAAGIADSLLACTIMATTKQVVFAPAMNSNMYSNPIIQEKIQYLKDKGYGFIGPIEGALACGKKGLGHLAEVKDIVDYIEEKAMC